MLYRAAATSIANWAEEQGGIPLFTIEGGYKISYVPYHAVSHIKKKLTGGLVL